MTNFELEQIVHAGKGAFTLVEPDYSKAVFAISCMSNQDRENGEARFWPLLERKERRSEDRRAGD
jgi:hypothetical protein